MNTRYVDLVIQRAEERWLIRHQVVVFLSKKRWLGYDVKGAWDRDFVFAVLKPRVIEITNYIFARGLCATTFLSQATQDDLWKIV